ncbi:hypothetical protein NBG4_640010 [Candidatus Sulfobium mesophilum]|uniref:PilZ domain-containing protein n=1 Tax=Candidatus Sulfobium mesophilum TaxID=2016548 RepID=A0A2U3QJR6_9BACT|nr:hypothetical protein NBG4_640010 [Candidatus Sulfobium mesophilum]
MKEHRRYKRFVVDILGVNGKMMFASEVEIRDISVGGISLRVDRRLNMGAEYTVKISNSGDEVISVKGSVVWSKLSGTKKGEKDEVIPLYVAGMKFINVSDNKMKDLISFIRDQGDFSLEKVRKAGEQGEWRCSMRFLVKPPLSKAVINASEDYGIKKLSLGGMLIESENPLKIKERVPMEILLPGNEHIQLSGRIASCLEIPAPKGESEGASRYDVGIEFLEIADVEMEKLQGFVSGLEKAV